MWTALIVLAFAGQVAWAVENMCPNVFVYDPITDGPGAVAVAVAVATMVALSAASATPAMLLVGALSDGWAGGGCSRPAPPRLAVTSAAAPRRLQRYRTPHHQRCRASSAHPVRPSSSIQAPSSARARPLK
ncbi:hypothetical protein ACTMTF_34925 [Nonomuraea sp. ZG12]|uniref:hypothetical protein n=1 Tax=Nonomuraea sp. ZG12 TaxID=3452207 RepID=UPI003F8AFAC3